MHTGKEEQSTSEKQQVLEQVGQMALRRPSLKSTSFVGPGDSTVYHYDQHCLHCLHI